MYVMEERAETEKLPILRCFAENSLLDSQKLLKKPIFFYFAENLPLEALLLRKLQLISFFQNKTAHV